MTGRSNGAAILAPIHHVLQTLVYIDTHRNATRADLEELLGVSPVTVKRTMQSMRADYGIQVTWHRTDNPGGRYTIDDWGVLDRRRVRKLRKQRS